MFLKLRFRGDRALNNWKFTFFCGIHMVIDANISVYILTLLNPKNALILIF